jgi:hypothetical protein
MDKGSLVLDTDCESELGTISTSLLEGTLIELKITEIAMLVEERAGEIVVFVGSTKAVSVEDPLLTDDVPELVINEIVSAEDDEALECC